MKHKLFLSFIVIVLATLKTFAQDYVLEGTIGNYPVFMELKGEGRDLVGTYYYTRQGPDKRLRVEIRYDDHGRWKMKEYDGRTYNGTFTIGVPTFKVGDTWEGSYTNVRHQTYNYSLTMKSIVKGAVRRETGKVGNNRIVVEYYNCHEVVEEEIGNYYYTSQGPQKRLALAWEGAAMSKSYYYDYLNGKKVGEFIYRSGYDNPFWEYVNAQGRSFRVTFDK